MTLLYTLLNNPKEGRMKARLYRKCVCLLVLLFNCVNLSAYTLFKNGKSSYTIVTDENSSPTIALAVSELQNVINQISGVYIKVEDYSKENRIFIGTLPYFSLPSTIDLNNCTSDESFVYFSSKSDIYIVGKSDRACLYGVYSFLENELGCRWYGKNTKYIPSRRKYTFTHLYNLEEPAFEYRNVFYKDAFDKEYAAHLKSNWQILFNNFYESERYGGVKHTWGDHSFSYLMPVEKYFASHPEYFSLRNGERISKNTQLCLSNPDVLKICTEAIRKVILEHPDYSMYSLAQFDNQNYCQCANCNEIAERYGGQSGLMIWFVNQIAEELEKEFPSVLFGTSAYRYTRKAPKNIKLRHNVSIRLCSIECCFSHPFEQCAENESFMNDLREWSKLTDKLFVWDYVVSFSDYLAPFPNFRVLQENVRTLRKNNVIGIFEEGAHNTSGTEFSDLRAYIIGKILWNPECDVDALVNDYMRNVYGSAGKYVKQYYDLLQNKPDTGTHIHYRVTYKDKFYSEEFVEKSLAIFKQAEKAADNNEILKRVEYAELPVCYLQCRKNPEKALKDGCFELFKRVVKEHDISRLNEQDRGNEIEALISVY